MTAPRPRIADRPPDAARTDVAARRLIHRANNFLTLCLTHGELALRDGDPAEALQALREILGGAEELRLELRAEREALDRPRPRTGEVEG